MGSQTDGPVDDMQGLLRNTDGALHKPLHIAYSQRGLLHCERGDLATSKGIQDVDVHCTRALTLTA